MSRGQTREERRPMLPCISIYSKLFLIYRSLLELAPSRALARTFETIAMHTIHRMTLTSLSVWVHPVWIATIMFYLHPTLQLPPGFKLSDQSQIAAITAHQHESMASTSQQPTPPVSTAIDQAIKPEIPEHASKTMVSNTIRTCEIKL